MVLADIMYLICLLTCSCSALGLLKTIHICVKPYKKNPLECRRVFKNIVIKSWNNQMII